MCQIQFDHQRDYTDGLQPGLVAAGTTVPGSAAHSSLLVARRARARVCVHGVRQMAMLNAARKARIQSYLNADAALQQAADKSKRYTESTRDQPQHSDPLMHGLIQAVARDRFPDLGESDMFSELSLPCLRCTLTVSRCSNQGFSYLHVSLSRSIVYSALFVFQ